MRLKKISLLLLIVVTVCGKVVGQSDCGLPPFSINGFDTANCKTYKDTTDHSEWIAQTDNTLGNRFLEQFMSGSALFYFQHEKNQAPTTVFAIGHKICMFTFYNNGSIYEIKYQDSCKITTYSFDTIGHLRNKTFCDYSKPDDCNTKYYIQGKLYQETKLTPFSFTGRKDLDSLSLPIFYRNMKTIPYKDQYFDKKGAMVRELKVDVDVEYPKPHH